MKKLVKKAMLMEETIESYASCTCTSYCEQQCSCSMLSCLGDYGIYMTLYNPDENSTLSSVSNHNYQINNK